MELRILALILIHNDHDNEMEIHYNQLILSINLQENLKLSHP